MLKIPWKVKCMSKRCKVLHFKWGTHMLYIYIYHIFNRFTIKHKKDPILQKKRQALGLVFRDFSMQTYDRSHLKTPSAIHLYRSSTASKKHREIKKTKHPKEDPWSWHIFLHLNHVDGIVIGEYTSHIDPVGPIQVLQNGLVDTSA